MVTFGRRISGQDVAYGIVNDGWMRAVIVNSLVFNAWVIGMGARCGRYESAIPTVKLALYEATSTTVTNYIGATDAFSAPSLMLDRSSGADYYAKSAGSPMQYWANQNVALAIRAQGGRLGLGQNASGLIMHQRYIGTGFPDTFGATQTSPEGMISVYAELVRNTPPYAPSAVSPAAGALTTDTTPTLAADFRDLEEQLTGYSVGQADKLSAYRFDVFNADKSAQLYTSGKKVATTAQQAARRFSWDVPTALGAGTYTIRAYSWDLFDTASPAQEWQIVVSTGGVMEITGLSAQVAANITNDTTPEFTYRWTSTGGVSTASRQVRILDAAAGNAVVRPVSNMAASLAPGASQALAWPVEWPVLPAGRYFFEIKAIDTQGIDSPWVRSAEFRVNGAPTTPTSLAPPTGKSFAAPPQLEAVFSDLESPADKLTVTFNVRLQGASGNGVSVASKSYVGDGKWIAQPSATEVPTKATYEWSVIASDPYGLTGTRSAWRTFVNANKPLIIIVSPPAGPLANGTPTFAWTVDRIQKSFRLSATNPTSGAADYDSGRIESSVTQHVVPPGYIHNLIAYDWLLEVEAVDLLSNTITISRTVQYPPQGSIAGFSSVPFPAMHEPVSKPREWSTVRCSWIAPSIAQVPNDEFGGYVVRRRQMNSGIEEILAHLQGRNETVYIDRTIPSGEPCFYYVSFLRKVNRLDYVESSPSTDQAIINLRHTVISEMTPEGRSLPLRFWRTRKNAPKRDVEIVETLGRLPVAFQGLLNYRIISGQFEILDNEESGDTWREQLRTFVEMLEVDYNRNGRPIPKPLFYRDPTGRACSIAITEYSEDDSHDVGRVTINITGSEVATRTSVIG